MELVEKGTLELKAADALKIIELKQKMGLGDGVSDQELRRPFLQMLNRIQSGAPRRPLDAKRRGEPRVSPFSQKDNDHDN